MNTRDYAIIVFCNKLDLYLARICIASIRYYYPDVDLYLNKDHLNGYVDATELEQAFNVRDMDLGTDRLGWGAGKMHLLLSDKLPGKRILILDADIVFIGKVLDRLHEESKDADWVVSPDYYDDPHTDFIKRTYYDLNYIHSIDPEFKYPGYLFNTGQLLLRTNTVNEQDVDHFYDMKTFPYWKLWGKLPLTDQSILNYILPKKEAEGKLTIAKIPFMLWSEGPQLKTISFEEVKAGTQPYLIHWAGAERSPHLSRMTRDEVMKFFEDYYYQHIRMGSMKKTLRKTFSITDWYLRRFHRLHVYPRIKKIIKR